MLIKRSEELIAALLLNSSTWPLSFHSSVNPKIFQLSQNMPRYLSRIFHEINFIPVELDVLAGESALLAFVRGELPLVVKFFLYNSDALTSVLFYQQLKYHAIAGPAIIYYDCSHNIVPYGFLVMECIDHVNIRCGTMTTCLAAAAQLGTTLRRLHTISTSGYGALKNVVEWNASNWEEVIHRDHLNRSYMRWCEQLFTNLERSQIRNVIEAAASRATPSRLLHGDLSYDNLLYTGQGEKVELAGLIDPGEVIGGDPMFDLAVLHNIVLYDDILQFPGQNINVILPSTRFVHNTTRSDLFLSKVFLSYYTDKSLNTDEERTYAQLALIHAYTIACWQRERGIDCRLMRNITRSWLEKIAAMD